MKKNILILVLTIILIACGKKQIATYQNIEKKENDTYKIKRIDSINNVYIIYASKPDSLFKIVSLKNDLHKCNKIEEGKSYHFVLKTAFLDRKSLPLDINGLEFYNVTIRLEGDSIRDIYTSKNLNGLCFIKN